MMSNNCFCKIIVAYHKPAKLFDDRLFVPVNVGRVTNDTKLKNGILKKDDVEWLNQNTIGDDTGDNISAYNFSFNELTAVYWGWKHYIEIGNPDYIGLCHYRRVFDFENSSIEEFIGDNDIIAAGISDSRDSFTIKDQYLQYHKKNVLDDSLNFIEKNYPFLFEDINEYLNLPFNKGCFYNMFLMKKEIFFEYCECLFSVLMYLHKRTNYAVYSVYGSRLAGFIGERLSGAFFYHYKKKGYKLKIVIPRFLSESDIQQPTLLVEENKDFSYDAVFQDIKYMDVCDNCRLLYSSLAAPEDGFTKQDGVMNVSSKMALSETGIVNEERTDSVSNHINFVIPYDPDNFDLLELTLKSILLNVDSRFHCSIMLLVNSYKKNDYFNLKLVVGNYKAINSNFSISLVEIEKYLQKFSKTNLHSYLDNPQFWFVFCPFIFSNISKVIWINRGMVLNKDISFIFDDERIKDCDLFLGVTFSLLEKADSINLSAHSDSFYDFSHLEDVYQTNILLFNHKSFKNTSFYKYFISSVRFNSQYNFFYLKFDNNDFNANAVFLLDYKWGVELAIEFIFRANFLDRRLSLKDYELYMESKSTPYAICVKNTKYNFTNNGTDYLGISYKYLYDYLSHDTHSISIYKLETELKNEFEKVYSDIKRLTEEKQRLEKIVSDIIDVSYRNKVKNHKKNKLYAMGLIIQTLFVLFFLILIK